MMIAVSFTAQAQAQTVSMGHVNMITTDIAAEHDFWLTLGGISGERAGKKYVKFPGVIVTFSQGVPAGGTVGTVINHFGLQFSDLERTVAALMDAGYQIITETAVAGIANVSVDAGHIATNSAHNVRYAFALAPNGARIELYENNDLDAPVSAHHVHFYSPHVDQMKAWYVATFGAAGGTRADMEAADIEGINLTFSYNANKQAQTLGRALSRIGFEVAGLETMMENLRDGADVRIDQPYSMDADLGIYSATVTDPWGTAIKLTEGLNDF